VTARDIFLIVTFLFSSSWSHAQNVKNIELKDEKISRPLKYFFICSVKDDRTNTSDIGTLRTGLLSSKIQRINLENGANTAIYRFLSQNAGQDTSANPIIIHITQLKIEENGRAGLQSENELTIALAFYSDTSKLVEYTGGGTTKSTGDASKAVEELIRGNVETILYQFEEWWLNNRAYYLGLKIKPSVKVEVTLDPQTEDPDLIPYSPIRPLTLDDFLGKPDGRKNTAAISAGMLLVGYSSVHTVNNEILVDVSVQANFQKSKSWVLQDHRNEETLKHEQGHFDILAIKACELVDTIRKYHFSVDNFSRELDRLQREKREELNQLQDQYDSETGHGAGPELQSKWNQRIKEGLQKSSCYHS
jgi:hypothetical protein